MLSLIIRSIVTPDCSDYNSGHVVREINTFNAVLRDGGRGPVAAKPGLLARAQSGSGGRRRCRDRELSSRRRAQFDSQGIRAVAAGENRACDGRSGARARTLATTARDRTRESAVRNGRAQVEREFF